MKKLYTLIAILSVSFAYGQEINQPYPNNSIGNTPIFATTKAVGDSCGAYFNNYIGLAKTTSVFADAMRTGNGVETTYMNGRAQRFTTSQPVEISGLEFYAYKQNTAMDSIMVITSLNQYDVAADSVGVELTRDTVYVTHTAFDVVLPNISVKSYFDSPITMTTDYILSIFTPTDDSLFIVINDYLGLDGGGENQGYALYDNPVVFLSSAGWYANLNDFGYDYDCLINPYIKYDLHDSFTVLNDSICRGEVGAGCVNYTQVGNFSNQHYNGNYATPESNIVWLWDDGFQNTAITSACHTYNNAGLFSINLKDTLYRYDYNSPTCIVDISLDIFVQDSVQAGFTYTNNGLTADFTNTSINSDSIWWNYGDATSGSALSHTYSSVGTYDVWLYAYNDCFYDSTMVQVTVDNVGLEDNEKNLAIYPNPANTSFVISGLQEGSQIEIMNILGEIVLVKKTSKNEEFVDVAKLPTGSYFVQITTDKYRITKKIIVRH